MAAAKFHKTNKANIPRSILRNLVGFTDGWKRPAGGGSLISDLKGFLGLSSLLFSRDDDEAEAGCCELHLKTTEEEEAD